MSDSSNEALPQKFNFVGHWRLWFTIAGLMMTIGLGTMLFSQIKVGQLLNWGIDFTGGSLFEWKLSKPIPRQEERSTESKIRTSLSNYGLDNVRVTLADDTILFRTQAIQLGAHESLIHKAMTSIFPNSEQVGSEKIGPVIGQELRRSALLATILGLALVGIWIAIRYQPVYALGAGFALLHDVLVLLGFMAIFKIEINSPFVAVLLTVVGYSVNDSVVIFDRIRENRRIRRRSHIAAVANFSLNETLPRSINTSLTTSLVLLTILLFGALTIRDMALSLLIGIIAGTYSSIFLAAPLVVWFQTRGEKRVTNAKQSVSTDSTGISKKNVLTGPGQNAATEDISEDGTGSTDAQTPGKGHEEPRHGKVEKQRGKARGKRRRRRH